MECVVTSLGEVDFLLREFDLVRSKSCFCLEEGKSIGWSLSTSVRCDVDEVEGGGDVNFAGWLIVCVGAVVLISVMVVWEGGFRGWLVLLASVFLIRLERNNGLGMPYCTYF